MNDKLGQTILRPHVKLEKNFNGNPIYALKFTDSEFDDIIFSFDSVNFIEKDDKLVTKFDYTVHEFKRGYDKKSFEKELGDFLIEMVIDGISKNDLIFAGGTDEGRENDIASPDNE